MAVQHRLTGRIYDSPSDLLPRESTEHCEHCGTKLVLDCIICGAPNCCPKCCAEAQKELAAQKEK